MGVSPTSHHRAHTGCRHPPPENGQGGLGMPTYLPAVSTLVADNKSGHGLIRAAGLHLWGGVVRGAAQGGPGDPVCALR